MRPFDDQPVGASQVCQRSMPPTSRHRVAMASSRAPTVSAAARADAPAEPAGLLLGGSAAAAGSGVAGYHVCRRRHHLVGASPWPSPASPIGPPLWLEAARRRRAPLTMARRPTTWRHGGTGGRLEPVRRRPRLATPRRPLVDRLEPVRVGGPRPRHRLQAGDRGEIDCLGRHHNAHAVATTPMRPTDHRCARSSATQLHSTASSSPALRRRPRPSVAV